MGWRRPRFLAVALLGMLALSPVAARPLPEATTVARPEERWLLPMLAEVQALGDAGEYKAALEKADALLLRLDQPTPMRGLVAFTRALLLDALDQVPEARRSIDEAMRLLPGHSGPLQVGALIYSSLDAARSADLWLTLSRDDPQLARDTGQEFFDYLFLRLQGADERRLKLVQARLAEIGYARGDVAARSAMTLSAVRAKAEQGDLDGATSLVPEIQDPRDHVRLLIDKRYMKLWLAIERWAGPRLEKQWDSYLSELQRSWEASRDLEHGVPYARALVAKGEDQAVIDTFLTIARASTSGSDGTELLASVVARALTASGRIEEAIVLLQDLAARFPPDADIEGLNFVANLASQQLYAGRPAEALATIGKALDYVERTGSAVNASAVAPMQKVRACALVELGRTDEAAESIAFLVANRRQFQGAYIDMLACTQRHEEARDFLIRSIEDEELRNWALSFVQPRRSRAATDFLRRSAMFEQTLRRDPAVVQAANRHGRLLSFEVW